MKILTLHLKKEHFRQILLGAKIFEFRRDTPYWRARILNKAYDKIYIRMGYPPAHDPWRCIERPWNGYEMQTIQLKEFGTEPVDVFAIKVN